MTPRAADRIIVDAASLEPGCVPAIEGQLHTDWTDGRDSVASMISAGQRSGLVAMLFSEHSRRGSGEWFREFASEVRTVDNEHDTPRLFVGTEVRINGFDGDIDLDPIVAEEAELVLASVHRFPGPGGKPLTFDEVDPAGSVNVEKRLMLAAVGNANMDILSHPFGMSLTRFSQNVPAEDWLEVIEATVVKGVAFEINSKYHADPAYLLDMCIRSGARISIGSDAHDVSSVGDCYRRLSGFGEGRLS